MSLSVRSGVPHLMPNTPHSCKLSEALRVATIDPTTIARSRKADPLGVRYPDQNGAWKTAAEREREERESEGIVIDHTEYTRAQLQGEIEELEVEIANWNRKKGVEFQERKKLLTAFKKALKKKLDGEEDGPLGKLKQGIRKDRKKLERARNKAFRQQRRDFGKGRTAPDGSKEKSDWWLKEQNRLRVKYNMPLLTENDLEVGGKKKDRGEDSSDSSEDEDEYEAEQAAKGGGAGPSGATPPEAGGADDAPVAVLDDEDSDFDFDDDDGLLGAADEEEQAVPGAVEGDVVLATEERVELEPGAAEMLEAMDSTDDE